jgi:predicted nucleotidyltransferase
MNPIDKMILFGSQTDGTASKYSDYDIIIILKNNYKWQDTNEILDWCYDIDLKYNIVTDIKIISLNELNSSRGKQPYVINALKNGISI